MSNNVVPEASSLSVINFDSLAPQSFPVTLEGRTYTLWEASADAGVKYRDGIAKRVRIKDGKPSGLEGHADLEAPLIAACLKDPDGKLVPEATIKAWPHRVQRAIFNKLKEMSQLEEDPSKNSLSNGRPDSD